MDANCIFCKIVKGEIPADVVYEDDKALAFLDIHPVNPGHVLVVPKSHHPTILETPDAVVSDIFVKAKKLMIAIKEAAQADFIVLSVVGTDVPHLHLHLIPRYHKDGLQNFWPTKEAKREESKKIAEKIRDLISKSK
ncbi:MAG TPA: HIT family protein [Candidatus Paceibacterota bacterium]